jgi:putative membrane protein
MIGLSRPRRALSPGGPLVGSLRQSPGAGDDESPAGGDHGRHGSMSLTQRLLLSWLTNAIVLALAAVLLTKMTVASAGDLILAAALFGILNTFLKPIARLLTLPFAIITLGLAWFFVSMLMLYLTQAIVSGVDIHGFWTLVWATLIVWAANLILDRIIGTWRLDRERAQAAV